MYVKCTRAICSSSKNSYFTLCIIYKKLKINIIRSVCKVAKVTVSISTPVHSFVFFFCPFFHLPIPLKPEAVGRVYVTFHIKEICSKINPENSHFVKIGQNNKQFIWRTKYIHDYLVASVSDL